MRDQGGPHGRVLGRQTTNGQADAPAGEFTAIIRQAHTIHAGSEQTAPPCAAGLNFFGRADAPAGEFTAISAGEYHSPAGIRADRTAVCWGADDDAAAKRTLLAGELHRRLRRRWSNTCGIRADKTHRRVLGLSTNARRQYGLNQCQGYSTAWWFGVPAGEFIAVAAGWQTCGIRVDRTITSAGAHPAPSRNHRRSSSLRSTALARIFRGPSARGGEFVQAMENRCLGRIACFIDRG